MFSSRLTPPGARLTPSPGMLHRGSPRSALALLIGAISLAGCAGLPDQRLANEALKRGDTATASQNYQQLADLGFVDAKVGVADIQVMSGDPVQIAKAEATYRAALDDSPRAQARLGRLLAIKPNPSEANKHEAEGLLKRAFSNNELNTLLPLTLLYLQYPKSFPDINPQHEIDKWRAARYPQAGVSQVLLYRLTNVYDQHLDEIEKLCTASLKTEDSCYIDLATVYQKQANTDKLAKLIDQVRANARNGTVPLSRVDGVARVITDPTIGKTDEKTAQTMLEEVAPKYPAAWVTLAQVLYDFPELGDVGKMMTYLNNGRAADQPRADLLLGKLYYEGKWVPQDPFQAEKYLLDAARSQVAAHYYLGQLYRRGYLGHVYSQKAVDNLLVAARGGQNSADFALAQLFSMGRGTVPSKINAYVFSQLALNRGNPLADDMAKQLDSILSPAERSQAQKLLQQERDLRASLPQQIPMQVLQAVQHDDEQGEVKQ